MKPCVTLPAQPWFFYLLKCRDNSLYAGVTTNLERRLKEHNAGTGARYTSGRRPVVMVFSEKFNTSSEAKRREAQVKSWARTKKETLFSHS